MRDRKRKSNVVKLNASSSGRGLLSHLSPQSTLGSKSAVSMNASQGGGFGSGNMGGGGGVSGSVLEALAQGAPPGAPMGPPEPGVAPPPFSLGGDIVPPGDQHPVFPPGYFPPPPSTPQAPVGGWPTTPQAVLEFQKPQIMPGTFVWPQPRPRSDRVI